MIQRPRGTRDFPPEEAHRRRAVREKMIDVMERWGYREVATPTFEHLELFTLKSGEGVIEEIYSFKDKGGRDIALRPELTAPVMRMYVSELHSSPKPLRLYYFANCFRYERPQKGRFREFWQLGCELIGGKRSDSEAEVIAMADEVLRAVGIKGDIHIGYLGLMRSMLKKVPEAHRQSIMRLIDKKERDALRELLQSIGAEDLGIMELISLKGRGALDRAEELSAALSSVEISTECAESVHSSMETACGEGRREGARASARSGRSPESEVKLSEFREMLELLDAYGVEATVDFEIVRGLEYYTGTVFEIYTSGLGAQNQICGGGSYELASLFGGSETFSTGFGLGFDRIMEVVGEVDQPKPPVVLAFTPDVKIDAIRIAKRLRNVFPVIIDVMGRSLSAQLKSASAIGAEHVIIVGRRELDSGKLVLRNMVSGSQEEMSIEEIEERLRSAFV
ncbi:histidine--tRNA ligase [Methanothrix sp.]|uniref:histidine--tRNA ligase n=1 Tax=Methanothrix sp. TaxID=90426 RepID=UPI002B608C8F|nr:histidine--tRNA ligase [Methanothrix sp.]HOK57450.1 histidine--tRNA ligase [Methanothrix sp.]HOL42695.1 histidine--tRNA ligase [Methanothrix sp.]HPO87735.1 histidine--tRNA ligase [Methanothrix sp.]